MRAVLFGFLAGGVMGLIGPLAVSSYYQSIGDTPDAGAGTAFAVMTIFTVPAGAVAGAIAGWLYAIFTDNY